MDAVSVSAERVAEGRERILSELRKVIVGQDEVVEQVLLALFTGGHCLITGVPGLAKTLLIKTLADILDLDFKRIQFTPDLMPSDITGTEILDEGGGGRCLRFVKGPIFAQIILADEINRTPPKTQAALLRARHTEPDRARRHVSPARGAARSLHVQHRHLVSLAG
jgi:MoxR-like ATPase